MATKYSGKIEGSDRNYKWAASFDIDCGYLGITQYHSSDEGNKIERVLLSPKQVRALAKFCGLTQRVPDAPKRGAKVVKSKSKKVAKSARR
jgi:hypothetical protein